MIRALHQPQYQRAELPELHELPIPHDVKVTRYWSSRMVELAEIIGPYSTLLLAHTLRGGEIYIAPSPSEGSSIIEETIGIEKGAALRDRLHGLRLDMPLAAPELRHARLGPLLAAVRAGILNVTQAARIARTSRSAMSHLVHHSDEGRDCAPLAMLEPRATRFRRDVLETVRETLEAAGADQSLIDQVRDAVNDL